MFPLRSSADELPMGEDSDEVRRLRGYFDDLAAVVSMPSAWRGHEPSEVIDVLLERLCSTLKLEFAYAQVGGSEGHQPFAAIHGAQHSGTPGEAQALARSLEWWLSSETEPPTRSIPDEDRGRELFVTRLWLGLDRNAGVLVAASRRPDFPTDLEALLLRVAVNQVVIELQEARVRSAKSRLIEIERLKNQLQAENIYLREEREIERYGDEIVGQSAALKDVLDLVGKVAPTKACVLIQGETGTGKELVARAIHRSSDRKERTFVKLNCAAIPTGLLESELFGHERGAFTGAIARKLGRFELADGGTIFLDEVAEIPLELQAKMLRVLQEHEFERLGGTRTIRVDVRLVAASNRDLAQMVETRQFRSDLYYRLNVFPISVPPLRERPEDIPLLVRWFTERHAIRSNKTITSIPAETMEALVRYSWPGNIRELENLIERSVILSRGSNLEVPLGALMLKTPPPVSINPQTLTLEEAERQHIYRALNDCGWVIAGPHGAAAKLGMKRTSLQYKMQKLGINRQR